MRRSADLSRRAVVAGGLLAASGCAAPHARRDLIFATTIPPVAPVASLLFEPWARAVERAAGGRVRIRVVHGSSRGSSRTIYDSLLNGVCDIAYLGLGAVPGWFRRTNVVQLPFVVEDGVAASAALWRLHERGLFGDELAQVHTVAIHSFPPLYLHTRRPVATPADLRGSRIIGVYQLGQRTLAAYGAAPLSLGLGDAYLAISQGLADGIAIGWAAFPPFRLGEVAPHHVEVPLGAGAGAIAVRREVWHDLSPEVRHAFESVGGLAGSVRLGAGWSAVDRKARGFVQAQRQAIVDPGAQLAAWKAPTSAVVDAWTRETPDGPRVLSALREELAHGRATAGAAGAS